jgi:hypothetical protein
MFSSVPAEAVFVTDLAPPRRLVRRGLLTTLSVLAALLGPLAAVAFGHGHTVSLSANQVSPVVGEPVTFTATGVDGNPGADRYDFDVGGDENLEQSGPNATFTTSFPTVGPHEVWVFYDDGTGEVADAKVQLSVVSELTGSITAGSVAPTVGQPVQLAAGVSGGKGALSLAWDVDGDGFDDGTGAGITATFDAPGARTIRVRARDSASPAHQRVFQLALNVQAPPPTCLKRVAFALVEITTQGCFRNVGTGAAPRYESADAVKVNGIPFPAPGGNRKFVATAPRSGLPGGRIAVEGTTLKLGDLTVLKGNVNWNLPAGDRGDEKQVVNLTMPAGQKIFGLEAGGSVAMKLGFDAAGRRYATFPLNIELPELFKSGPDAQAGGVSGTGAIRVDERGVRYDGLKLVVKDAWIGKLKVEQVCFSYLLAYSQSVGACEVPELDGRPYITCNEDVTVDRWDGNAIIELPTKSQTRLAMFGGLSGGKLGKLGGFADKLGTTVPITESVFLNRVGVGLCLNPPPFKLRGDVGMAFAPPPAFQEVLGVDGYFLYTDAYAGRPWSLEFGGTMRLYGEQLGSGSLILRPNGAIDFTADTRLRLLGLVSLDGKLVGWIETPTRRFNIDGTIKGCLDKVCGNTDAVVSSSGLGGCLDAGTIVYWEAVKRKNWKWYKPWRVDWVRREVKLQAGFGHRWKSRKVDVFGGSCHLGDYQATRALAARTAQANGAVTVEIPAEEPAVALRIAGAGAPPKLRLRGPDGTLIESPSEAASGEHPGKWLLVENPSNNSTSVLLIGPASGRWVVEPKDGSTVTSVETAEHEPAPQVIGAVTGKGKRRTLSLAYHAPRGAEVSVVEVGTGVHHTIAARVKGKRCRRSAGSPGGQILRCARLRFTPTFGHDHTRRVEAVVTRGSVPIETLVVDRFRAEKPRLPGTPGALRIIRKRSNVTIAWRGVTGAATYNVVARLSDGRKLGFHLGGRCRSVRLGAVTRQTTVRVKVLGLRLDHESGKPATLTLKPNRKRAGARANLPRRACS